MFRDKRELDLPNKTPFKKIYNKNLPFSSLKYTAVVDQTRKKHKEHQEKLMISSNSHLYPPYCKPKMVLVIRKCWQSNEFQKV